MTWKSPITPELITAQSVRLGEVHIDLEEIYFVESRPSEKGRSTILKWNEGKLEEILPQQYNARSKVHEYGGGAICVENGEIFFSNFQDQYLYHFSKDQDPSIITKKHRYANHVKHPHINCLYSIEEKHLHDNKVINSLVKIDLDSKNIHTIHEGHDFYASPTAHPDGSMLAWITWDMPNMPWDGSSLWIAAINPDGTILGPRMVAGGKTESIYGPKWGPDGYLYYTSDRSGYWNLYRLIDGKEESLYPMDAEFGEAQWIFGTSRFDFFELEGRMQIACIYTTFGIDHLAILDPDTNTLTMLDLPYKTFQNLHTTSKLLVCEAGSPLKPLSLITVDPISLKIELIRKSLSTDLDPGYISEGKLIEFPTENDKTAFAFFYPPKNKDYEEDPKQLAPLIVKSHGGPSGHVKSTLNLEFQYWTSRGFGILDVNYGGSTGHGRAYRERLNGTWGVVDVDDCINGAKFLVQNKQADPERLIIKGGSAGGYTTLAALTFRDVFKAGVSYYGVSDLEALVSDTHKFEARYLDQLIGPYPEKKDLYLKRGPIHHIDKLSCPLLLLQGADDKVVLPNQAEMMYKALLKKGIPVSYLLFENEGHGFRMAETIKKCLEAELYFYTKIFQIPLSEEIPVISIQNLD